MGAMPVGNDASFARFLKIQYASRECLDAGFAEQELGPLGAPPSQLELLDRDLASLGHEPMHAHGGASFHSPAAALGAAWVVSGSSMGNRAMLSQRRKHGLDHANAFLADSRMPTYFRTLLPLLAGQFDSTEQDQMIDGATLAFTVFLDVLARSELKEAA
ncbi:hypothetical protein K3179_07455 [Qipengyuania sp. GH38]|uniref:hypothetical protein n=1 Tax=Qipengyuania intermedia TaxID=2867244 RepID=UPI001C8831FC|nr:hypothetical protein [Qipengyuania intermedia]MBX7514387.1 hypothetical protein [Qipengyuania intermedia]